jgi:RNA polymerase sigma-70 factor (ECF subfamily)
VREYVKRRGLAALAFVLAISALVACRQSATVFETISSDAFTIHYPRGQEETARDVLRVLEENLPRMENDLRPPKTGAYTVRIYGSVAEYHRSLGMPVPDWVVGSIAGDSELRIVSPSNPGPANSYQRMLKTAVHELAHCVTYRLTGRTPPVWLWESIASFEAGDLLDPKQVSSLHSGSYPRFLSVTSQLQDTEIYQLGFTVLEYIVHAWSMESVRQLVLNGGDIGAVLGVTEEQFYEGWYAFVQAKYL